MAGPGWTTVYPRTSNFAPLYRTTNAVLDAVAAVRLRGVCRNGKCGF